MASLLSPRRNDRGIVLRATAPTRPSPSPQPAPDDGPRPGWVVMAVAGGLLCALAGWLLVAGLAVVGWVTAEPGTLVDALVVGTVLWLAGHGVAVDLGGLTLTLVPWGVPVLLAYLLSRASGLAVRSARAGERPRALAVALVTTAAYAAPVLGAGGWLGRPDLAPGHLLAVGVVLSAGSLLGSTRAGGTEWTRRWPAWARALPRAVLASQLVLVAAGATALVTALARHVDRASALHQALEPGLAGGVALLLAQLALAPNAVVWAASYALGGGFTLGNGSLVAPSGTDLGVLPGLPLLAALPGEGPGPTAALWWLAAGVLAGAAGAWLVVRARPQARFDETSLVGGAAGVLGGLVFVALAWATSGDLGTVRLAGLGPLLLPLLVMGVTTLGLSGMLTGLLLGLAGRFRRLRPAAGHGAEGAGAAAVLGPPPAEATQVLRRAGAHDGTQDEPTGVLDRTAGVTPSEEPGASR